MTVGVSGPWTPFATLSASMARTRRKNCQISLYARRDPPAQEGDISALEKRGHFCFALTRKTGAQKRAAGWERGLVAFQVPVALAAIRGDGTIVELSSR